MLFDLWRSGRIVLFPTFDLCHRCKLRIALPRKFSDSGFFFFPSCQSHFLNTSTNMGK